MYAILLYFCLLKWQSSLICSEKKGNGKLFRLFTFASRVGARMNKDCRCRHNPQLINRRNRRLLKGNRSENVPTYDLYPRLAMWWLSQNIAPDYLRPHFILVLKIITVTKSSKPVSTFLRSVYVTYIHVGCQKKVTQCFPKFFTRGLLSASKNNRGSSHSCLRKYWLSGT